MQSIGLDSVSAYTHPAGSRCCCLVCCIIYRSPAVRRVLITPLSYSARQKLSRARGEFSTLADPTDAKCAEGSLGRTGDGIEWSLLVHLLLPEVEAESRLAIKRASKMVFAILGTVLDEAENDCVHPLIHTFLAFLQSTASIPGGLDLLEDDVPWPKITGFLNRYLPEVRLGESTL